MAGAHFDLDWWPPDPDERIGEARARELVEALRTIGDPVVAEATADLRTHVAPGTELAGRRAPASYLARIRFGPGVDTLCVGSVSVLRACGPCMCSLDRSRSLHLHRDGRLTWRRDRSAHVRGTGPADRWAPSPVTDG